MLSRIGRFFRGLRGRTDRTPDTGQANEGERSSQQALQAAPEDSLARDVIGRTSPVAVSRRTIHRARSVAISDTRPLAARAQPEVRRDVPLQELPLASGQAAPPAAAGKVDEPGESGASAFFEGSTGDARWDALWEIRGSRRETAPTPDAKPSPHTPAEPARPSAPAPQPRAAAGPSVPPQPPQRSVQRTPEGPVAPPATAAERADALPREPEPPTPPRRPSAVEELPASPPPARPPAPAPASEPERVPASAPLVPTTPEITPRSPEREQARGTEETGKTVTPPMVMPPETSSDTPPTERRAPRLAVPVREEASGVPELPEEPRVEPLGHDLEAERPQAPPVPRPEPRPVDGLEAGLPPQRTSLASPLPSPGAAPARPAPVQRAPSESASAEPTPAGTVESALPASGEPAGPISLPEAQETREEYTEASVTAPQPAPEEPEMSPEFAQAQAVPARMPPQDQVPPPLVRTGNLGREIAARHRPRAVDAPSLPAPAVQRAPEREDPTSPAPESRGVPVVERESSPVPQPGTRVRGTPDRPQTPPVDRAEPEAPTAPPEPSADERPTPPVLSHLPEPAAGQRAMDSRQMLRQALQPRIVPAVVQATPAEAETEQSSADTAPGPDQEGPDVEALARDVYRILRRRLLVECERDLGRV